jgi:magnesium chelatase family protein
MSLAVLYSRALTGIEAPEVIVEVHLANGLPSFTIVGLPEAEVKESKDRVRAALQTAQFEFPSRRITVNLAPADLPKESGRYDLPIALGILAASGQIPKKTLAQYEIAGELALTGELRPIRGALAMAVGIAKNHENKSHPQRTFILPKSSATEAALVNKVSILGASSLLEVCAHLSGQTQIPNYEIDLEPPPINYPDFSEVKGQTLVKRALEIAAAGGHSILML